MTKIRTDDSIRRGLSHHIATMAERMHDVPDAPDGAFMLHPSRLRGDARMAIALWQLVAKAVDDLDDWLADEIQVRRVLLQAHHHGCAAGYRTTTSDELAWNIVANAQARLAQESIAAD